MDKGDCWVLSTVYAQFDYNCAWFNLKQADHKAKERPSPGCLWFCIRSSWWALDTETGVPLCWWFHLKQSCCLSSARTTLENKQGSTSKHCHCIYYYTYFATIIQPPFSFSVCWTLQISPLGFLPFSALYNICHPSYFCIYFKVCKQTEEMTSLEPKLLSVLLLKVSKRFSSGTSTSFKRRGRQHVLVVVIIESASFLESDFTLQLLKRIEI